LKNAVSSKYLKKSNMQKNFFNPHQNVMDQQHWVKGSVADPYVFGPPGSGSRTFYHQAKIVRKTLIPTVL
jgi:hypothetical protein